MNKKAIEASSKTYRKATRMVADRIGVEHEDTKFPSDDFARIVKLIKAHPNADMDTLCLIAEKYFQAGVRKGLRVAVKGMASGHFRVGRKWISVEDDTAFVARVMMPDQTQKRIEVSFTAESLGLKE